MFPNYRVLFTLQFIHVVFPCSSNQIRKFSPHKWAARIGVKALTGRKDMIVAKINEFDVKRDPHMKTKIT
jgi:hypothetical protein